MRDRQLDLFPVHGLFRWLQWRQLSGDPGNCQFPGGGRIRNYMFVARPDSGPLAGRDAMVFLSLLRGGNVEVRLIAGPGLDICDPGDCATIDAGECDYFGVFGLSREPL